MFSRGVLFAVTRPQVKKLLAAKSDEERIDVVQEKIEGECEEEHLCETDKAWNAVHRCLTDGTLNRAMKTPLSKAILGGQALQEGEDYLIYLIPAAEVAEVAQALDNVTEAEFRTKYFSIDPVDYGHPTDEQDFHSAWDNLEEIRRFYLQAQEDKRAVIFTVDQ